MKPSELYQYLVKTFPTHEVNSICCVNTTCKKGVFCSSQQSYPVIDFDEVKNDYCKRKKMASLASVDAVCVGGKKHYFCFVELKGWEKYIKYFREQKNSIVDTIKGYNLEGKLADSQKLCADIVGKNDLFVKMPVVFLLVTDIDVKTDGMDSFAEMMFTLSETSTIYSECVSETLKSLDFKISIEHDYISCKDFDKHVATL